MNGYTHTFAVPEKRIATGPIRRMREKAAVEVVQAMSPNVKQQMAQELGWHDSAKNKLSSEVEQRISRKARVANEDAALWAKPEHAKKLEKKMREAMNQKRAAVDAFEKAKKLENTVEEAIATRTNESDGRNDPFGRTCSSP